LAELGRTRVFAEAYTEVRRRRKPAENDAQWKKGHFWMETANIYGIKDPAERHLTSTSVDTTMRRPVASEGYTEKQGSVRGREEGLSDARASFRWGPFTYMRKQGATMRITASWEFILRDYEVLKAMMDRAFCLRT
jgi:hypothetical protein